MMQDFIDMDTKKIRYVSESSNASTSGYSTMSPGAHVMGNSSPTSSVFSSPVHSPASALQTGLSNLTLPSAAAASPQYATLQTASNIYHNNSNQSYLNYAAPLQFDTNNMLLNAPATVHYNAKLRILEHPVEKFRFRYKSEMHGTHGSLNGANSKRTPKTFPEVELCNFHGNAVIRCSLYQANLNSPHSHQLVVRKDDTDICDPHDMHVSPELGYVVQFQNMGIIHTAKKFIFDELLKKKTDRLRFELGQDELSNKQLQDLQKQTEREAKDMNLNQVRLCFEAFKLENNNIWTRIAAPVFTSPINNRKSAQTGELRICRLSVATGGVNGGDDLILLVEKVSKKNIKVRFFEVNEDEECVWEAFGQFRESDVHHQYAIVCRTPPYKDKDIDKPVEVNIELIRPSDDERSYPAVTFRYKPRDVIVSRKRRRTNSVSTNSTSSGLSMNSVELPITVQEQTANMNIGEPFIATAPTYSTNMFNTAPNTTISEEFNKAQYVDNLLNDFNDSEELFNLLGPNFPSFDANTLETDGIADSSSVCKPSSSQNTNTLRKNNVMTVSPDNKCLQPIFKLYELARIKKCNDTELNKFAQFIADLLLEHAEQQEQGDSIMHEIIVSNDSKVGIHVCKVLSYFKLHNLLNRLLNAQGESALHCACLHNRPHFIRPLLGLGADPNLQDAAGNTALHIAVREQHLECVDSFLQSNYFKLNVAIRNDEGWSALHLAIRLNNCPMVGKLLKHSKSAAAVHSTKEGNNALHMAVLQQNMDLLKLLLDSQTNKSEILTDRNAAGLTAVDLARSLGSKEGAKILEMLSAICKTINTKIAIKNEEDDSLSSTEEDDDSEMVAQTKQTMENVVPVPVPNFEKILKNKQIFNRLVKELDVNESWRQLAEKCKMQHLLCLWSNADDMLSYVCQKANSIDYHAVALALSEVNAEAYKILQTA